MLDLGTLAQQQAAAQAAVNQMIVQTGIGIYAQLIGKLNPEDSINILNFRRMASRAKEAAPFLAEAFGMISINNIEDPLES